MIKFKFLILFLILVMLSSCSGEGQPSIVNSGKAADFTLKTLDGQEIVLSQILKQKRAVLLFWTTWCPYCRKELQLTESFYKQNKHQVAVIAINVKESKVKVENFVRNAKVSYPVALDTNAQVAKLYNLRGVPKVMAVDRDSQIIYNGYSTDEMKSKIGF